MEMHLGIARRWPSSAPKPKPSPTTGRVPPAAGTTSRSTRTAPTWRPRHPAVPGETESDYSPGLALLRSAVIDEPVLVLAPEAQIADEHAEEFIDWELRGVVELIVGPGGGEPRSGRPPDGVRHVITGRAGPSPPYAGAELVKRVEPYRLWLVGAD